MNIKEGFQIDEPDMLIPWGISEEELKSLFPEKKNFVDETKLKHVTQGYYTMSCVSLGGLEHELGFHFEPRSKGKLNELEFFRKSYPNQKQSYDEFQEYFEKEFGNPTATEPGDEGFPTHEWIIGNIVIHHYILDRYGPEERLSIKFEN